MTSGWDDATHFEKDWWGTCSNTYGEEEKQLTYARKMGLHWFHNNKSPYNIDCENKNILDIGGGPVSLLLKAVNLKHGMVIDPCDYPRWIGKRYEECGLLYHKEMGEVFLKHLEGKFDEVWIYNVLQHTEDPRQIIRNASHYGKLIRIFEWVDMKPEPGHPQILTENNLNNWLHGEGKVEILDMPTLRGKAYYGIFPTI